MSCGNPHETDCREVLSDVYVYLDNECDQASKAKIVQHLDECSPCLAEYGIEQEIKSLVHRCCGNESAPESLREKLKAKLRAAVFDGESPVAQQVSQVGQTESKP